MCVASGAHECWELQQFISPCLFNCKLDMHNQYVIQRVFTLRLSFLLSLQLHLVVGVVEAGGVGEEEEGEGEEEEADASIHSLYMYLRLLSLAAQLPICWMIFSCYHPSTILACLL